MYLKATQIENVAINARSKLDELQLVQTRVANVRAEVAVLESKVRPSRPGDQDDTTSARKPFWLPNHKAPLHNDQCVSPEFKIEVDAEQRRPGCRPRIAETSPREDYNGRRQLGQPPPFASP